MWVNGLVTFALLVIGIYCWELVTERNWLRAFDRSLFTALGIFAAIKAFPHQ